MLDVTFDDFNPYTDNPWRGSKWHCIRCGTAMKEIKHGGAWGAVAWAAMQENKTLWFLCNNEKCVHRDAPLILHHPVYGTNEPAGDSYGLSWVE